MQAPRCSAKWPYKSLWIVAMGSARWTVKRASGITRFLRLLWVRAHFHKIAPQGRWVGEEMAVDAVGGRGGQIVLPVIDEEDARARQIETLQEESKDGRIGLAQANLVGEE